MIVIIVVIFVLIVTESLFKVEFYPEPQSFYRTNFPSLFVGFRSPFEVEFYPEPRSLYRTNFQRPFTGH